MTPVRIDPAAIARLHNIQPDELEAVCKSIMRQLMPYSEPDDTATRTVEVPRGWILTPRFEAETYPAWHNFAERAAEAIVKYRACKEVLG
jgi:hypothetical protein